MWLVLLACLRGVGLSQAQVPWQTSLAAFAFVRLLTVLPLTPGGLGITELGLIATLAAGAGHRDGAQVTAAVLLYRAVTYLPPIPLGAIACLTWRHAPALIHAKPADAGQPADMSPPGPDLAAEEPRGEPGKVSRAMPSERWRGGLHADRQHLPAKRTEEQAETAGHRGRAEHAGIRLVGHVSPWSATGRWRR